MKQYLLLLLTFIVIAGQNSADAQVSGEQLALQQAMSAPTDSAKLAEVEKFIAAYPKSPMLPNAYAIQYQVYSHMGKDSAAMVSIRTYLSLIDRSQLVPALNAVAYDFAQRKFHLGTAAEFIDSAIALYEKPEPTLFNTKALILFQQKKYQEAESLQAKAVALLPENALSDARFVTFFVQYGFIQLETAFPLEGIKKIISGNLVAPKQRIPVAIIDSLLASKISGSRDIPVTRDSLYAEAVEEYIRRSQDTVMAKSNIAVGLAKNNILTSTALRYAEESYHEAQSRTIEERSGAAAALGLTYFHLGKDTSAERYLTEAVSYAPPTETELFVSLGELKERLGKKNEAMDHYITGMMVSRSTSLYQKLIELKNELFPLANLDSIIVARQAAALEFAPEQYQRPLQRLKKNEKERVVLAELFTGSECRPCQAADVAFDYLIERYNASTLAILEYHLHIPLPDPLSNDDAERRSEFYGVNSTPTAVFNGRTVITSGGTRAMAKNKFYLYSDIVEREAIKPTDVSIQLTARMVKGTVTIQGMARTSLKGEKLRLRIVLVEDEVHYKGANGIEHHKFVVRKMIPGPDGIAFPKNGIIKFNKKVQLSTLVKELEKYYQETNNRFEQLGSGLKEKKHLIDSGKIGVVAFVQDDGTREVFQAITEKVIDKVTSK